jgi:soluble lytic murein transglycosylase
MLLLRLLFGRADALLTGEVRAVDLLRQLLIGIGVVVALAAEPVVVVAAAGEFEWSVQLAHGRATAVAADRLARRDREHFRRAFAAARANRWSAARRHASRGHDPQLHKILYWLELAGPAAKDFSAITSFVERNPGWPRLDDLRRRAEEVINSEVSDQAVLAWFGRHEPVTAQGAIRFAEALIAAGNVGDGERRLRRAWVLGTFTARNERAFLRRHRNRLRAEDHVARLDRLLWDGHTRSATRMLRRVDKPLRALAKARMALMRREPGVDGAVARVPANLVDDPGLVYERLRWRRRKGMYETALEMLARGPEQPPRPERWWIERAYLAREALVRDDTSVAYRIASDHGQAPGASFAEAEWLAGWIALRFLGKTDVARVHFERMYEAVGYPISRARGAYWAGRAAEAAADLAAASKWYEAAATRPTTYYGQLAAAWLGTAKAPTLPEAPTIAAEQVTAFGERELVRAVRRLAEIGEDRLVRTFVRRLNAIAETPAERLMIAHLAEDTERTDLAVYTARRASLAGVSLIDPGYPTLELPKGQDPDPALVYAVIRQESGFDPAAISGAGAHGLMQLMPATARTVSRRLRTKYSKRKLIADPDYNVSLGRAYLASLIDEFDGSHILALAAYNAGPRRVRRWIRDYGNPRDVDPIDWIESIPIAETRNYVQRVLEGLYVYRLRLGQAHNGVTLADELH